MAFTFPAMVAWDPTGKQTVKNVSFQVYAPADTAFTTPLTITDPFGGAMVGNILNSGTMGVFPQFQQASNATVVIADAAKMYAWTVIAIQPPTPDSAVAGYVNTTGSASALAVKSEVTTGATKTTLDTTYGKKTYRVNVLDYGANGNGVFDNTTAFNNAIAAANAYNPSPVDAANVIGCTIVIPDGDYIITGALNAITRSGVRVAGQSTDGTRLLPSVNGSLFTWGTVTIQQVIGGGISNLKIEYTGTPGASAVVVTCSNAGRLAFRNLMLVNIGAFVVAGTSSSMPAASLYFHDVTGFVNNSGNPVWDLRYGAGLHLDSCRLFVGGVGVPTANRTSTMTTAAGTNVINAGVYGTWDTIQITGCFFERFEYGLKINATSGVVVNDIHLANTYFDYHKTTVLSFVAQTGGVVSAIVISNCWFAAWENDTVLIQGPGTCRQIALSNCRFVVSGQHGLHVASGAKDVSVSNCQEGASNRTNINAMGVAIYGGDHITITGCNLGADGTWGGYAWQAYSGLYVAADIDYFTATGNTSAGTGLNYYLTTNTVTSKNRIIANNAGANYAGAQTITLPATGVAFTNMQDYTIDAQIYGGTVTGIAKNGTTITGMTSGLVRLAPGETLTVTYSSAPSVTWFGLP